MQCEPSLEKALIPGKSRYSRVPRGIRRFAIEGDFWGVYLDPWKLALAFWHLACMSSLSHLATTAPRGRGLDVWAAGWNLIFEREAENAWKVPTFMGRARTHSLPAWAARCPLPVLASWSLSIYFLSLVTPKICCWRHLEVGSPFFSCAGSRLLNSDALIREQCPGSFWAYRAGQHPSDSIRAALP